MKQITQNTFSKGLNTDIDTMITPNDVLTDCLNGTFITYNGNEFVLQNDFGNAEVETSKLKPGFIPVGMQEYGGIIYVASYNPLTQESEFGSFPSPERNLSARDPEAFMSTGLNTATLSSSMFLTSAELAKNQIKADLMKPTDFTLSPGDKFAVYFTNANNFGVLRNLLTDVSERKFYKLKVVRIADGGITPIDNFNIYDEAQIAFDGDAIEYDVFNDSTIGTLGIIIQIETIDSFNATVREQRITGSTDKFVVCRVTSECGSKVKFKGFKLDIEDPSGLIYSKYIYLNENDDTLTSTDSTFRLTGFEKETEYRFVFTPFSQFNLYQKDYFSAFKVERVLKISEEYPQGANKFSTEIFKYYVGTDTMRINYDFNIQSIDSNCYSFVEIYDVWSNCSVIKKIDVYDNSGPVVVTFDMDNSDSLKVQNTFNSSTIGGIPTSSLTTWALYSQRDDSYKYITPVLPTLGRPNQGNNVIKSDAVLVAGRAYVVRLIAVDVDKDENGADVVTSASVYRYMELNTTNNTLYYDSSISNMSEIDTGDLDVAYNIRTIDQTVGSLYSSEATRTGDFRLVNGELMPYNYYGTTTAPTINTFKTEYLYDRTNSATYQATLDETTLNGVYGIPNYDFVGNATITKGTPKIVETKEFQRNLSLQDSINTASVVEITDGTISKSADNKTIDATLTLKGSTSRGIYGKCAKSTSNIINVDGWSETLFKESTPSGIKTHAGSPIPKIVMEFGLHKYKTTSLVGTSWYYNDRAVTFKESGFNFSNLSQGLTPENANNLLNTAEAGVAKENERGGPDGSILFNFVKNTTTKAYSAIYANMVHAYYATSEGEPSLSTAVNKNRLIFMPLYKDSKGVYSYEFAVGGTFTPDSNFDLKVSLGNNIEHFINNFCYVEQLSGSYYAYYPVESEMVNTSVYSTTFKQTDNYINIDIVKSPASKFIMYGVSDSVVDYTMTAIKSYVNQQAAAVTDSVNIENNSGNVFGKVSSTFAKNIKAKTISLPMEFPDVVITPALQDFELQRYLNSGSAVRLNDELVTRKTFADTGFRIKPGVCAKLPEYEKYEKFFKYDTTDKVFYLDGTRNPGYCTLGFSGGSTTGSRQLPDVLPDLVSV